jgi:hypothetical protein
MKTILIIVLFAFFLLLPLHLGSILNVTKEAEIRKAASSQRRSSGYISYELTDLV